MAEVRTSGSGLGLVANPATRNKRPSSFGVRTVELTRSQAGFGLTLSGQQPCLLSGIVQGSPAARAGLRVGQCVVAVNGRNVVRAGHDEVVCAIGNSTGLLKLQIADNYYGSQGTSSSEEDLTRIGFRTEHREGSNEKDMSDMVTVEAGYEG